VGGLIYQSISPVPNIELEPRGDLRPTLELVIGVGVGEPS